jgi:hypothetical protein
MTTVGNVSSDEVTIANVYDEIVSAGTFVAFDDLGKTLQEGNSVRMCRMT